MALKPAYRSAIVASAFACAAPRPALPPLPASSPPLEAGFRARAPQPTRDVPYEQPVLTTRRLENGIQETVIARPAQKLPTLAVLFGSLSGANLMDRIVVEAIRREVNASTSVGCWVSRFEGAGGLGVLVDATPDAIPEALEEITKAVTEGLPKDTIEKARLRLMRQRASASRRGQLISTILRRARYGEEHPWGRDAISQVQAMGELDADELVNAVRRRISPDTTHLVYSGPTRVWEAQGLEPLMKWRGEGAARPDLVMIPDPRQRGKLRFHMLWSTPDESSLFVMHVGPGVQSADHAAFTALCHLLGGMLSEAGREFRHEGGATYGVHSSMTSFREASECMWRGTFEDGRVARAVEQHVKQLDRIRRGEIDAQSLAAARGQVRTEMARRFADPRDLTRSVASQRALGLSPEAIVASWAERPDLTDRRLRSVAERTFHPPHLDFVALVGSSSDYYALSARGADIQYKIESADD